MFYDSVDRERKAWKERGRQCPAPAMFPTSWELRLMDLNVEPLDDSDLGWADLVLTSTMIVQQRSLREVLARCGSDYDTGAAWQNSGFSVHNTVTVGAKEAVGTERLARYLLRPPLSLERMSLDADGSVLYRRKARGSIWWHPEHS